MKILPAKLRRRLRETPVDLARPAGRLRAWVSLYWGDHGFLRTVWSNSAAVDERMARRNQPSPGHIAKLARAGVNTIINLRGESNTGFYALEREACARAGVALEDFRIYSRAAPSKETVFSALELFERIEYPAVMHCKSGADRAGLMAALYLLGHRGRPLEEAQQQLSLRYGHIRAGKTGVLDAFLEAYAAANAEAPIAFRDWLRERYDAEAVQAAFKPPWWGDALVDIILRRE